MKTILIPFRDDEPARAAVVAGCRAAIRYQSYVEGLFIQTPPLVYASEGIAIGGYVTQLADEERRRADEARARFAELVAGEGLPFHDAEIPPPPGQGPIAYWRQVDGLGEQIVGEYGRIFDLVCIGRETGGSSPDWNVMCEAALFDSGRLLLLASPEIPVSMGRRIVILWNGSTETARTIALSMPFLLAADEVVVLTIEGAVVPGPTGEQAAQSLLRHGLNVSAVTRSTEGRTAGEALLEEAAALGADLLVKGAYAQSRFRQMIFGGATRHILNATELPVLMAH